MRALYGLPNNMNGVSTSFLESRAFKIKRPATLCTLRRSQTLEITLRGFHAGQIRLNQNYCKIHLFNPEAIAVCVRREYGNAGAARLHPRLSHY